MNMQDPTGMNMMKQQFPEQEQLKCPRCESSNTKFCYYNNYNLSQPRHFCKSCRRYWTKGGSLRNIPVGGGTRKNAKRPKRHNPDPDPTRRTSPHALSSPQASAADHDPTQLHALPGRPDPTMMDITGTFSSLLAATTTTHFMNPNGSAPKMADSGLDPVLEEQGNDGSESYLLQSGESGFWGGGATASGGENGWPDLAIYTPGSSYQ